MKRSEAAKLIGILMASYPHAKIPQPEATASAYEEFLLDLDAAAATRAVKRLIAESKFFPSIAEIRDRVASSAINARPAELAWGDVLHAVGRVGIYRTPEFDDPCTAIAVSSLGWRQICNADESEHGVMRAQFREAYKRAQELAKREHNADRLLEHADRKRLAGLHDESEKKRGGVVNIAEAMEDARLLGGGK